ncbi:MAG: hypothetical protein MUC94_01090, partial [bacterium]|nr:hypothetical protein [bacterium]
MISDSVKLFQFDCETYASRPGKHFWTPRDLLGECIYKAVLGGAKVVIVDISINEQVPVYVYNNKIMNENDELLKYLHMAGKIAKENDASIIFSQIQGEKPIEIFFNQMDEYEKIKDVFIKGFSSVYLNPGD